MRRKTKAVRFTAAGLVTLALGLAPLAAQDTSRGLIAGGESPDLFLLYTGDVIGYIEPCG